MPEEEKGFVIKDRRSFSSEAASEPRKKESREEKPRQEEKTSGTEQQQAAPDEEVQLPEVNFSTFVFSLSSSVFLHLGEVEDPSTGKKRKNLPMAKHTIDILGMLEEKTRGNLTEDEGQLLKNVLYDLRMRFVKEKP